MAFVPNRGAETHDSTRILPNFGWLSGFWPSTSHHRISGNEATIALTSSPSQFSHTSQQASLPLGPVMPGTLKASVARRNNDASFLSPSSSSPCISHPTTCSVDQPTPYSKNSLLYRPSSSLLLASAASNTTVSHPDTSSPPSTSSQKSVAVKLVSPTSTTIQHTKPKHPWWHEMIAGGGAGAVAAIFVSPLDVVRMRMQVTRDASTSKDVLGLGMMRRMVKNEGIRSLYRGLSANMIALVPNWTAYFVSYSQIKAHFGPTLIPTLGTVPFNIVSSIAAGAVTTMVTHPLWLVKARLQVQGVAQTPPEVCPKCAALTYCYSASGCNFIPVVASSPEVAAAAATRATGEHLHGIVHKHVAGSPITCSGIASDNASSAVSTAARGTSITSTSGAVPSSSNSVSVEQPSTSNGNGSTNRRIKLTPHTVEVVNGPPPPPRVATGVQYRGTWHALTHIVKTEGFTALYHGLVPQLLGLIHVGIQYPLYEWLKHQLRVRNAAAIQYVIRDNDNSTSTTSTTNVLTTPTSTPSSSVSSAKVIPLANKQRVSAVEINPDNVELSSVDIIFASTLSKIVACLVAYPHEVLRSRFQTQHHLQSLGAPGHAQTYSSLSHAIRSIHQAEGFRGFYKGITITLVRSVPACIVTFVSYEQTLKWFERWDSRESTGKMEKKPPSKADDGGDSKG